MLRNPSEAWLAAETPKGASLGRLLRSPTPASRGTRLLHAGARTGRWLQPRPRVAGHPNPIPGQSLESHCKLRSSSCVTFCYVYAACVHAGYVYRRSCKHSIALGSRYDAARPPSPCRTSHSSQASCPGHKPGQVCRNRGHAPVLLRTHGKGEMEHHCSNPGACCRRLGCECFHTSAGRRSLTARGHRRVPAGGKGTQLCPLLKEPLAQLLGRRRQDHDRA